MFCFTKSSTFARKLEQRTMAIRICVKTTVIITVFIQLLTAVQALSPAETSPNQPQTFQTPLHIFIKSFRDTILSNIQLTKLFTTVTSAEEWSIVFYDVTLETVEKIGVAEPVSLSAMLSHAILHTLTKLTQDDFLYLIGYTAGSWLLAQDHMTLDDASLMASGLAFHMAMNIMSDFDSNKPETLAKAIEYGMYNFMMSQSLFPPDREPAFTVFSSKICYRTAGVKDPELGPEKEVPISDWDSYLINIPSGTTTYGMNIFIKTFLDSVSASELLSKAFFMRGPMPAAVNISNAWYEVIYVDGTHLKSNYSEELAKYFAQSVRLTFDNLPSNGYATVIGNGLGLFLLSQGVLNKTNAESLSKELTDAMEVAAKKILKDDDLVTHANVVGKGFKSFAANHKELFYNTQILSTQVCYLSNELFYMSVVKEPYTF